MSTEDHGLGEPPRRFRRAEAVLRRRSGRVMLVLERLGNDHNNMAILRTAEAMGVQTVWSVEPEPEITRKKPHEDVTRGATRWLTLRTFTEPAALHAALAEEGWTLWATDVDHRAEEFAPGQIVVPDKVAIAMGREGNGLSPETLAAADKRIFLPMHGFTASYNVSVATALILQRVFDERPDFRGDLSDEACAEIRGDWYRKLEGRGVLVPEIARLLDSPPEPIEDLRVPYAMRRARVPRAWAKKMPDFRRREPEVE